MTRRWVVVALLALLVLGACSSSSSGGVGISTFCNQVKEFRSRYGNVKSQDANEIKAAETDLRTLAHNAPSDIKADATTVADAFAVYASGKTPPADQTDTIQRASDNLMKYGEDKCGIQSSTPTT